MILSKPIIMNEYSSNNIKNNNNQIINIQIKSLNQILNADLLSKKIKIKLKSKEIGNKNIKFAIFNIFKLLKKKYKTINPAIFRKNISQYKFYKNKINN
jgi:hypothetical protein